MSQQPLSTAASFVVFNSQGAFVNDSFPFARVRILGYLDPTQELIISMAVSTGYSDLSSDAQVLLNGVPIGVVDPYPFGAPSFSFFTISIVVPPNKIPVPFDPITHQTVAVLQVVPSNANNWLLVDWVVCHFHVQGATVP